jgi:hypothetical protein
MFFLPKRKQCVSITKISWLMLFKEMIAIYYENNRKPINTVRVESAHLLNAKAGGTHSYH